MHFSLRRYSLALMKKSDDRLGTYSCLRCILTYLHTYLSSRRTRCTWFARLRCYFCCLIPSTLFLFRIFYLRHIGRQWCWMAVDVVAVGWNTSANPHNLSHFTWLVCFVGFVASAVAATIHKNIKYSHSIASNQYNWLIFYDSVFGSILQQPSHRWRFCLSVVLLALLSIRSCSPWLRFCEIFKCC